MKREYSRSWLNKNFAPSWAVRGDQVSRFHGSFEYCLYHIDFENLWNLWYLVEEVENTHRGGELNLRFPEISGPSAPKAPILIFNFLSDGLI